MSTAFRLSVIFGVLCGAAAAAASVALTAALTASANLASVQSAIEYGPEILIFLFYALAGYCAAWLAQYTSGMDGPILWLPVGCFAVVMVLVSVCCVAVAQSLFCGVAGAAVVANILGLICYAVGAAKRMYL